jgi:hypothetical protein
LVPRYFIATPTKPQPPNIEGREKATFIFLELLRRAWQAPSITRESGREKSARKLRVIGSSPLTVELLAFEVDELKLSVDARLKIFFQSTHYLSLVPNDFEHLLRMVQLPTDTTRVLAAVV